MALPMQNAATRARPPYGAYAMLVVVMILWSGNSMIGRAVRSDIPPLTLAFGRWALASVLLLPFAVRPVRQDWPVIRQHWLILLVFGLIGISLFNSLLYTGLHHSTASNALLIQAGVPGFVMLFNRTLFGVRARWVQMIAAILAMIGVAVIVFRGDLATAGQMAFGKGDLILVGSAAVWALYTVMMRKQPAVSPITFVAVTFGIGVVTLAPFALAEWLHGLRVHWTLGVVGAYGYVAILSSLAAYFLFNAASLRTGPVIAGQAITLLPLFGAVVSALILGEQLHFYHAVGMALIFVGIVLGALSERRASSAGAAAPARLEDAP